MDLESFRMITGAHILLRLWFISKLFFGSVTNWFALLILTISLSHDLLVGSFAGTRQLGGKDVIMRSLNLFDILGFKSGSWIRLILGGIGSAGQCRLIEILNAIVLARFSALAIGVHFRLNIRVWWRAERLSHISYITTKVAGSRELRWFSPLIKARLWNSKDILVYGVVKFVDHLAIINHSLFLTPLFPSPSLIFLRIYDWDDALAFLFVKGGEVFLFVEWKPIGVVTSRCFMSRLIVIVSKLWVWSNRILNFWDFSAGTTDWALDYHFK